MCFHVRVAACCECFLPACVAVHTAIQCYPSCSCPALCLGYCLPQLLHTTLYMLLYLVHRLWRCLWHCKVGSGYCIHGCDAPRIGHEVHHSSSYGWCFGHLWPHYCCHHLHWWYVLFQTNWRMGGRLCIDHPQYTFPAQWVKATHSTRAMPTWVRVWRAGLQVWQQAWQSALLVTLVYGMCCCVFACLAVVVVCVVDACRRCVL